MTGYRDRVHLTGTTFPPFEPMPYGQAARGTESGAFGCWEMPDGSAQFSDRDEGVEVRFRDIHSLCRWAIGRGAVFEVKP